MNSQSYMFCVTLNGASPNKLFNEITIRDDFVKFRKMLQSCYSHAPYYSDVECIMEDIYNYEDRSLGKFMLNSFNVVLNYVGIKREFILSSTLQKDNSLRGASKVIAICKELGTSKYSNALGGQSLYDKKEFRENGIELKFLKPELVPYKQFKNDFVAGLSIIDVMMFNSPEEIKRMFDQYELI